MIGAIIGDIVGSRFEFNNHRSTQFQLFHKDCSSTDDTIMTIATADALLHNKDFANAYQEWGHKYPAPMGGYGANFARWLNSPHPQPYYSFGNGSAMRVSPIGWFFNDEDTIKRYAYASAKVTHDHPEGIKGAETVALLIFLAQQRDKEKIKNYITTQTKYDISRRVNEIRKTNNFNETCQVTVPQAITCFLESNSFEEAIRLAISIGGDSDTIAAITGSIAEAYYGVPDEFFDQTLPYLPKEMKDIIREFYFNI